MKGSSGVCNEPTKHYGFKCPCIQSTFDCSFVTSRRHPMTRISLHTMFSPAPNGSWKNRHLQDLAIALTLLGCTLHVYVLVGEHVNVPSRRKGRVCVGRSGAFLPYHYPLCNPWSHAYRHPWPSMVGHPQCPSLRALT